MIGGLFHPQCFFFSPQPPQARHSVSLCPRTLGTQTEAEAHPDVADHFAPSCPKPTSLSQQLAWATEEPPWSRAARPLIRHSVDGRPLTHYLHTLSVTLKKKSFPPLTIERNKWLTNNNSSSSPTKARNYYNYTILD